MSAWLVTLVVDGLARVESSANERLARWAASCYIAYARATQVQQTKLNGCLNRAAMHHIMGCRFVLAALPLWCAGQPLCTQDNTWRNCSYAVATMATRPALLEVALFLRTLRRFDASRPLLPCRDICGRMRSSTAYTLCLRSVRRISTSVEAATAAGNHAMGSH